MAHAGTHGVGETESKIRSRLLYGLNDKLVFKDALFVAFQHVCAIFIPVVTPGLIITGALGLDAGKSAYILGMSLFVSGLGTLIQCHQLGSIGSGLLSVQGTSFAFVTPILAVVAVSLKGGKTTDETLALILGLCFFGSFIPMLVYPHARLSPCSFIPMLVYPHYDEPIFTPDSQDFYAIGNRDCSNADWPNPH